MSERKCDVCGGQIVGRRPSAKRCGSECDKEHARRKIAKRRGERRCRQCGVQIPRRTRSRSPYCSDGCTTEAGREAQRRAYWRNKEARDRAHRERARRNAAALKSDPDALEAERKKRREYSRRYRERIKNDPERLEKMQSYHVRWRRRWRENPDNRERDNDAIRRHRALRALAELIAIGAEIGARVTDEESGNE